MTLWLRIKVWTRIIVFSVLLIYILIFVGKNSGKGVEFWYWYDATLKSSLLLFTFITFIAGAVVAMLLRTIFKTASQVREVQRLTAQRELAEMKAKAAMLQTRPATSENAFGESETERL
jgi:uncharacterized integral membrane protein